MKGVYELWWKIDDLISMYYGIDRLVLSTMLGKMANISVFISWTSSFLATQRSSLTTISNYDRFGKQLDRLHLLALRQMTPNCKNQLAVYLAKRLEY